MFKPQRQLLFHSESFFQETRFLTTASRLVGDTRQGEHLQKPQTPPSDAGSQTPFGIALYLLERWSGQWSLQNSSGEAGWT